MPRIVWMLSWPIRKEWKIKADRDFTIDRKRYSDLPAITMCPAFYDQTVRNGYCPDAASLEGDLVFL